MLQGALLFVSELATLDRKLLFNFAVKNLDLCFRRLAEYVEGLLLNWLLLELIDVLDSEYLTPSGPVLAFLHIFFVTVVPPLIWIIWIILISW